MGSVKTILLVLFLGLFAPVSLAQANTADDPIHQFATCAGRLSAEMEHQWLLSDPDARRTEAIRESMLDVLASLTQAEQGRTVLQWRIEAKTAHAALLSRATFRSDEWASDMAHRLIRHCSSLIVLPPEALETDDQS